MVSNYLKNDRITIKEQEAINEKERFVIGLAPARLLEEVLNS